MITVDQIRQEMQKQGLWKEREVKMPEEPSCKQHPDRPAYIAKSGRNMGLCMECIKAIRKKVGKMRTARKKQKTWSKRAKTAKTRIGSEGEIQSKLILIDAYSCPACGAMLSFEHKNLP